MTGEEKAELAIIFLCFVSVFLLDDALPIPLTLATSVLSLSALLLFQSLIRDIWRLATYAKQVNESNQKIYGVWH